MGVKISDATPDGSVTGVELVPVSDAGSAKSVKVSEISDFTIDQIEALTAKTPSVNGEYFVAVVGGVAKRILVEDIVQLAIDTVWAKAAEAAPDSADKLSLLDGSTEKTVTLALLAEYVRATVEAAILDVSDLGAAAGLSDTDYFLVTQGSVGKRVALSLIVSYVFTSLKAYVIALTENTTPASSDQFYVIQGGIEKWVDLDAISTYIQNTDLNISLQGEINANLVDTDTLLVDDGDAGTLRKTLVSRFWTYLVSKVAAATNKTTGIDADSVLLIDSADSNSGKEFTLTNLWTYISSKFTSLTAKTTPVDADTLPMVDSAASNVAKKLTFANLWVWITAKIVAVTDISTYGWFLDEDTLVSDSATKAASQQSIKAYVDGLINPPARNYLINGGFRFAQRLDNSLTTANTVGDDSYSADRWKLQRETADVQYSRQDGRGVTGLNSQNFGRIDQITASGKFMYVQIIEGMDCNPLLGKVVRFQCKLRGNAAHTIRMGIIELANAGTQDTIPDIVTTWAADTVDPSTLGTNLAYIGTNESKSVTTAFQEFSISQTIPADAQNIIVAIWTDSQFTTSDHLEISEAGLYLNDTSRSWSPRPVAEEISLCQRYFWKTIPVDLPAATQQGSSGAITYRVEHAGVAIRKVFPIQFPTSMRVTPSFTFYNPVSDNALAYNSNRSADSGAVGNEASSNTSFALEFIQNASDATNEVCLVHLSADAEI